MTARQTTGSCLCRPRAALRALAFGAALMALALGAGPARAEGARMALVVGNADYDALAAVPQAARDARDIAGLLERQDFEVSLLLNSDHATFAAAFNSFARRAGEADLVLFYFAGHGLRADGASLIAPIDMVPDDPETAVAAGMALGPLIDRLATGARPAVIVLDAARPFDLAPAAAARLAPGLGVPPPAPEAMVVMATQPGSLVPGDTGADFTLELGDALAVPGQPLEPVLQGLAARIGGASGGRQTPWVRSSLSAPLFLRPFQPDAADFERLAAMPEAQQAFLLDIWRSQGARLDADMIARRIATPEAGDDTAEAPDTTPEPPADTAAPAVPEAPRFSFEYIEEEEEATTEEEVTAEAETPPAAAPSAPASPAPGGVSVAALTARDAQHSPAVADAPIARIRANQDSLVLASLDPGRNLRPEPGRGARIIGKDVTDRFFAPEDLPRAVQTELARLGCYRAAVDGIWGGGSRSALRDYIARSGADLDTAEPTEAVWRNLKEATGRICPAPVARAPAPAPARSNTATRAPAPAPAPEPEPAPAAEPAADPATGGANGERLRRAIGGVFR